MNVSLTKELEVLVNSKVRSGMYQTASEVVREGLRLLKQRDQLEKFRYDIQTGFEEIERGDFQEYDATTTKDLARDIVAAGKARLAGLAKKKAVTK